jgi:small subunit ribosomal protein S11
MIKKKIKNQIFTGIVHIKITFNNTIVTVTDLKGAAIAWASTGSAGFTGGRKGTAFAAQKATTKAIINAKEYGLQKVEIVVKGQGPGREAALRSFQNIGVRVISIKDITAIPYNGCRPPKRRRV